MIDPNADDFDELLQVAVDSGDDERVAELVAVAVADPSMSDDPLWEGAVLADLADVYARAGRFDEAIAAMEQAIAIDPFEREVSDICIAEYHFAAGRTTKAREIAEQLLLQFDDDDLIAVCAQSILEGTPRNLSWRSP